MVQGVKGIVTVVVGLVQDGRIYMGADSAAVSGWNVSPTRLRKVFCVGEFIIGYAGSFRMGQILQYHLSVPQQQDGVSDERYMVTEVVEAVRQCLKDKGYTKIDSNRESGAFVLIGYRGQLYQIEDDFQVNTFHDDMAALGAGAEFALGALAALSDLKPTKRIKRALEISAQFSGAVCAPFVIETQ